MVLLLTSAAINSPIDSWNIGKKTLNRGNSISNLRSRSVKPHHNRIQNVIPFFSRCFQPPTHPATKYSAPLVLCQGFTSKTCYPVPAGTRLLHSDFQYQCSLINFITKINPGQMERTVSGSRPTQGQDSALIPIRVTCKIRSTRIGVPPATPQRPGRA